MEFLIRKFRMHSLVLKLLSANDESGTFTSRKGRNCKNHLHIALEKSNELLLIADPMNRYRDMDDWKTCTGIVCFYETSHMISQKKAAVSFPNNSHISAMVYRIGLLLGSNSFAFSRATAVFGSVAANFDSLFSRKVIKFIIFAQKLIKFNCKTGEYNQKLNILAFKWWLPFSLLQNEVNYTRGERIPHMVFNRSY